jgi:hypothetical protein
MEATINSGFGSRTVAATAMNAESSRSHLIVIVKIKTVDKRSGKEITGKALGPDVGIEEFRKNLIFTGN